MDTDREAAIDEMILEVASEFGPTSILMAEQFNANHHRRWSSDPRERRIQREVDRQALEIENKIIYGR
jgi:mitochondrial fission protein ELM1